MKERLLSFLFLGILLALAYHQAMDLVYRQFFPTARLFQDYWYVPQLALPALLLALLGFAMGFFRRAGWSDGAALMLVAATTILTLEAPYSCWNGCF